MGAAVGAVVGNGVGLLTEYDGAEVGNNVGAREGFGLGSGVGLLIVTVKVKLTTPDAIAEELTMTVVASTTETTVTGLSEKACEVDAVEVTTVPTLMATVLGTLTELLPVVVVQLEM